MPSASVGAGGNKLAEDAKKAEEERKRRAALTPKERVAEDKAAGKQPSSEDLAASIAEDAQKPANQLGDEYDDGRRTTTTPEVKPVTAGGVTVGDAPKQERPGDIPNVNATEAPKIDPVKDVTTNPITTAVASNAATNNLGNKVAGSADDAALAGPAQTIAGATIDQTKSDEARKLQREAAESLLSTLRGETPSLAMQQLTEGFDRAAAEQLSIAAGAQGMSTPSARRQAALNIRILQQQKNAEMAKLRAQEIESAQKGLGDIASQTRGQDIGVETSQAQINQDTQKFNAAETNKRDSENRAARETAVQNMRERFARGEITKAQLDTEIAKTNAEFVQRTQELMAKLKLEADQGNQQAKLTLATKQAEFELQARLASDARLQEVYNLEAKLKQQAAAGDQEAAVRLQALQAQIDSEIERFNASQIQGAQLANAENFLKAVGIDDAYIANLRSAWLEAERNGDQAALQALQIRVSKEIVKMQKEKDFWDKLKIGSEVIENIASVKKSDARAKTERRKVTPEEIDEFLEALQAPEEYEYKNPDKDGHGRFAGPMAQDVERSALGALAVGRDNDDGMRTLDFRRLAALALMAAGRLHQRMNEEDA